MKVAVFLFLVFTTAKAASIKAAPTCTATNCIPPACRCASTNIPANLPLSQVPQMVMLTFDDDVNDVNMAYYRQLYNKLSGGNGCPVGVTYYVSHEYNDYSLLHELYTNGHDISVHSISHKSDTGYWLSGDVNMWTREMAGMRQIASRYAALPIVDIEGDRAPFLQAGGDYQFKALYDNGLAWDSSLPTQLNNPPIWPYTLDYVSDKDCEILPCPVNSYPGFWEVPMVDLVGGNGAVCAMLDQCQPAATTPQDAFNLLKTNFDRHYTTNRAPFGVYTHASWFLVNAVNFEGYLQFLDYLATLPDVFVLNVRQVLAWMKNPTSLANISSFAPFQCPARTAPTCVKQECYYPAENTPFEGERYMGSCVTCPPYYPWLDNVDGLNPYPPHM